MLMQQPPTLKTPAKGATLAPWQQSLLEARAVAKMALGRQAGVQVAERNSGIYRGRIIGHTRDHVIQQIGNRAAAVIHAKDRFPAPPHPHQFPWPEVGHHVSIHYSQSRAVAREMRAREREHGRNR
jgi:hypothetical protein